MINMRKSRLSVYKQDRLIEHFVSGSTARTAASLVGVNKSTAAYFYCRLREIIVLEIEQASHEIFDGEIEVDESYFGGKRKGKRGRGAAGKVPVFGLLKRGGRVYTKIIPDASSATLMPIIERKVIPDSIVYSDCWRGYNVLDVSDFKHLRINHSLPIRLLPTPTKCGMRPFPGVKPVEGWRDCASRDSEQRAERVERIEAPIESKSELVEVGL